MWPVVGKEGLDDETSENRGQGMTTLLRRRLICTHRRAVWETEKLN